MRKFNVFLVRDLVLFLFLGAFFFQTSRVLACGSKLQLKEGAALAELLAEPDLGNLDDDQMITKETERFLKNEARGNHQESDDLLELILMPAEKENNDGTLELFNSFQSPEKKKAVRLNAKKK